jgi:phosphohistidine phosphatase
MKTVYLVRHAKSDWTVPGQKDFDRGLNARGLMNAPLMGQKLKEMDAHPDLILCSPASRTRLTAGFICEQLEYDLGRIQWVDGIYEASPRYLMTLLNELSDDLSTVLLIGHNPGITHLSEYFTNKDIGNVPTTGICKLVFPFDEWKYLSEGTGNLELFIYPKMFKV